MGRPDGSAAWPCAVRAGLVRHPEPGAGRRFLAAPGRGRLQSQQRRSAGQRVRPSDRPREALSLEALSLEALSLEALSLEVQSLEVQWASTPPGQEGPWRV